MDYLAHSVVTRYVVSTSARAILLSKSGGMFRAVIFSAPMALDIATKHVPRAYSQVLVPSISGYIQCSEYCGAYTVDSVVSVIPGIGRYLYEVSMFETSGLMPSRGPISSKAKQIWEEFLKRPNIQKRVTPKHCSVGEEMLDIILSLSSAPSGYNDLIREGARVLSNLEDPNEFESGIMKAGLRLFGSRY